MSGSADSERLIREFGFSVAHELDQRIVARIAGGYQRAVRGLWLVVLKRPTREIRKRPAGFVHQKIGRCKVPVVTSARRERGIKCSVRNTCDSQRERMHFRLSRYFRR